MIVKKLLLLLLFGLAAPVHAQAANCICATTAGCKVASTAWANDANVPTGCNIYKSGTKLVAGTIVDASTINYSNGSVCSPADAAYTPPAGGKACTATIPQQAAGTTVSLTVRGVNSIGEGLDGAVLSFQSVSSLPTAVPAAASVRVTP